MGGDLHFSLKCYQNNGLEYERAFNHFKLIVSVPTPDKKPFFSSSLVIFIIIRKIYIANIYIMISVIAQSFCRLYFILFRHEKAMRN